jgi:basic membrane protein A and related proteins
VIRRALRQPASSTLSAGLVWLCAAGILSGACEQAPAPPPKRAPKVGVLLDSAGKNDRGFNEYTLKGVRAAAREAGLEVTSVLAQSAGAYERSLEGLIAAEAPGLLVTVGFRMAEATASTARRHPGIRFVIIDSAYYPGAGCSQQVTDCYSPEGGLTNVTSLMSAEDQAGYLAGVLAACMSQSGTIGSVAGMEIPPVLSFVAGFQNGARSQRPDIVTLNQHIPDFSDPATGKLVAQDFIRQGADVLFAVAGNTGNGALLAAMEAGVAAIGVDVDQAVTYPEVRKALMTSASKNVDVMSAAAVRDFAAGKLQSGIRLGTLANGGVGLAPYHDWDSKIPQTCKDSITAARAAIEADPSITGAR